MTESEALTAALISEEARLLHGMRRPDGRDAELAREVQRINTDVRRAAGDLGFDDQPVDFLARLHDLRDREETFSDVATAGGSAQAATEAGAEIVDWSLARAAEALRARQVSSVELTRACLARAEAVNPRINCFIEIEGDAALEAARRADAEMARGESRGPLHGVPLAHKDMFYRAGKVTTGGSKIRRDFVAPEDSAIAKRLNAAGAIWLGTLNMSEFAASPTGQNVHFGDCRNPWNTDRITGGSSSGSAAAVAARACFGAIGSDTGGSVRVPAAICGVVGLKSTYGRVSRHGALPRVWSLDTIGPLARTAEDGALLAAAISGNDPLDATTSDLPVPDYSALLRRPLPRLRVGVPSKFWFDDVEASVRARLDDALGVLTSLGLNHVDAAAPDPRPIFTISDAVGKSEAATMHAKWIRERPEDYSVFVRTRIEAGFHIPATRYLEALTIRARLLSDFVSAAFQAADVLFVPAVPIEVPTLAESEVGTPAEIQRVLLGLTRYTRSINYLGLPGLTVPCGFSANGMPVAFQLVGRPFAEATLFRVAHAYQSATQWHTCKPPI